MWTGTMSVLSTVNRLSTASTVSTLSNVDRHDERAEHGGYRMCYKIKKIPDMSVHQSCSSVLFISPAHLVHLVHVILVVLVVHVVHLVLVVIVVLLVHVSLLLMPQYQIISVEIYLSNG